MARVAPHAPAAPGRPPIFYLSTRIESPLTAFADSPDIPVTASAATTQSENSVFVSPLDPLVLINSNNSTDFPVTRLFGADAWVSVDGGRTWTGSIAGPGGTNRGDPAAAIDRNGRMFVGCVSFEYAQGVAISDDRGASWTYRTVAPGPSVLDKNHLWVDIGPSSPFVNHVYSAWTNFQGETEDTQIEFIRSTDGGLTWTDRQTISRAVAAGSHNQGVNIQTGPGGEIYVAWSIYDVWPSDEPAIGFAKSLDGGLSFSPSRRILTGIRGHRSTDLGGGKTMRHNSFPSMAVDQQTGRVFLAWTNVGVPGENTGDPDIYLVRSDDGGDTWSGPTRVNQDPEGTGNDSYLPWLTCDPVTGLLACIFYDSRSFPANDMVETFVAISTDHGMTWQDFRVSDAAWSGDGLAGFSGNYAGDYIGISARENLVYPMWSDDRTGNMLVYVSPFTVPGMMAPVADFSGSPNSGQIPLTAQFSDLSRHAPTSWRWDFGDGTGSDLQNPSHTYASAGSYTVSLVATNAFGSGTMTKANYITTRAEPRLSVRSIAVFRASHGPNWNAVARVGIVDETGAAVEGATVTGVFNAPNTKPRSGMTDAAGVTVLSSFKTKTPAANWCFRVTQVAKSGAVYEPGRNVVTSACEAGAVAMGDAFALSADAASSGEIEDVAGGAPIEFRLESSARVRVEVFDLGGRRIATLADAHLPAGEHAYRWDRREAPAGVYFYRVGGDGVVKTGKIVVLGP